MGRRKIFAPVLAAHVVQSSSSVVPYLLDNFDGTGALTAHTPDIYPVGSSWAIINGTFGNLSGGLLPYTSGTYGKALIDIGVSDFELTWRAKYLAAAEHGGVMLRSNAAGSDFYFADMYISGGIDRAIVNFPSPAYTDEIRDLTSGEFYTWRVVCYGNQGRLYDNSGALMSGASGIVKSANTYVGIYTEQPLSGNRWEYIRVEPVTKRFWTFTVIGDSISDGANEWPGAVACLYNNGYARPYQSGTAQAGATIFDNMDTYTNQAETNNKDATLILLGTNDGWIDDATSGPGMEAEYEENLIELWQSNGKPIYAMGVLPNTVDSGAYVEKNVRLLAAVEDAQAAGVNVTWWDTSTWIDTGTDLSDGLHPNAAGHLKIANEVVDRL